MTDVLVIGAGPAGMIAALEMRSKGMAVTVVDDQPAPGGRIFASIETRDAHSAEDRVGASLVSKFRAAGGSYLSEAETWQLEPGPRVFLTHAGQAKMLEPKFVLLATGAQERPMPFPGWQLAGVMTVGAAQILLKTAQQIPDGPVWLAGSGPLLLLYARQLIAVGGTLAGILDTTPPGCYSKALRFLPGALNYGWRDLAKGIGWLGQSRGWHVIRNVTALEACGPDRLETVRYTTGAGVSGEIATKLLLIHDGVIPGIHATRSAGCAHQWNGDQRCFEPVLDAFGASSDPRIFVAGDGAKILGARAAILSGKLAAIGIARAAGLVSKEETASAARLLQRKLSAAAKFRQFVDTAYPPVELEVPDATLLCRCEEVTAHQIREALRGRPQLGPDGVKIATRAGMGPCQGRQCGLSITRMVEEVHHLTPDEIGFLRIRPPLKPLTLGELASLETTS